MAIIQLSADEINSMARYMRSWASDLESTAREIRGLVQNMDGWKDGQYQLFLQNIEMTGQHLQQYFENLRQMARSLEIYAERQREMQRDFDRDLHSIH